ncbi:hypothetical protein R1flu_003438 [Riccia fluitans]|uniref:Uncharacterized protein n=1 Tax=Riccia fluitans TaxID=41844 RepID=A0ABD1Y900_9MARC
MSTTGIGSGVAAFWKWGVGRKDKRKDGSSGTEPGLSTITGKEKWDTITWKEEWDTITWTSWKELKYLLRKFSAKLRSFFWDGVPDLDGADVDVLSAALKQRSSLRVLEVKRAGKGMSDVMLQAFTGAGSNRNLNELRLGGYVNGLPHLLKGSIPHLTIFIHDADSQNYGFEHRMTSYLGKEIGRAILQADRLQTLNFDVEITFSPRGILWLPSIRKYSWMEEVLAESQQSPKLSFSLNLKYFLEERASYHFTSLLRLPRLRDVHLDFGGVGDKRLISLEEAMDALNQNEAVDRCSIGFIGWEDDRDECESLLSEAGEEIETKRRWYKGKGYKGRRLVLEKIFLSSSIKELTLKRSFFEGFNISEEDFAQLVKLLDKNFTLQQIMEEVNQRSARSETASIAKRAYFLEITEEANQETDKSEIAPRKASFSEISFSTLMYQLRCHYYFKQMGTHSWV